MDFSVLNLEHAASFRFVFSNPVRSRRPGQGKASSLERWFVKAAWPVVHVFISLSAKRGECLICSNYRCSKINQNWCYVDSLHLSLCLGESGSRHEQRGKSRKLPGRSGDGREGETERRTLHMCFGRSAPPLSQAALRIILADRTTLVNNMAKKQPR